MFKFFRKYNKIILAVGGSLLMVIFLLPQASGMFQGNRHSIEVGSITVDGEVIELTVGDVGRVGKQLEVLRALGQLDRRILAPGGGQGDEALRWLLMLYEARSQGLYGSDAQTMALLDELDIDAEQIAKVKVDSKVPDEFIYESVRSWQMVNELQRMVLQTRRVSDPQMRHAANDMWSRISTDVVALRAAEMLGNTPQPTNEEITNQFERYKAQAPGQSAPYGFGYRLPAQVKLEYLKLPLERVMATVSVNDIEAARYYKQNAEDFIPQPELDAEGNPKPIAEGAEPMPRPFVEVLPDIRDTLRRQKAVMRQQEIIKWANALIAESERKLKRDAQGFREIPSDYVPVSFEQIASQIQDEFQILPDVTMLNNNWLSIRDIRQHAELARVGMRMGSGQQMQWLPVADYIKSCRELNPPVSPLKLQAKIVALPLVDISGNAFLLRITDAQGPHVPHLVAEVLNDVVRDVRALKVYTQLKDDAAKYVSKAQKDGMEALAKSVGNNTKVLNIPEFSRRSLDRRRGGELVVPVLPVVGRSATFVDAALELAQQATAATTDLNQVPAEKKIGHVALDDQLTIYVMKLADYQPVTPQSFERFQEIQRELQLIQSLDMRQVMTNPFSEEALKQRLQFIPPEGTEDIEPQEVAKG